MIKFITKRYKRSWREGYVAAFAQRDNCPYNPLKNPVKYTGWANGWYNGKVNRIRTMGAI